MQTIIYRECVYIYVETIYTQLYTSCIKAHVTIFE